MLLLLMLTVFLGVRFKNKKEEFKKNEEIFLVNEKLSQAKLESQQKESTRLAEELERKNKDLTNFALDIARKNEFTKKMNEEVKKLKATSKLDEKDKILQDLIFKTTNHLKINADFEHFQTNVENVNHQFFESLTKAYPNLTTNEKHLCGLIRLNLTIKDISLIKNISPKSVEMNRYRLRKKLHLDSDVDLNAFLLTL